MRKFACLVLLPVLFFGCKKSQSAIDDQIIRAYISSHHLNATEYPNGLYYAPTVVGTGPYPNTYSQIFVTYKGYLANDTLFAENSPPTVAQGFALDNTITGWQQGIPLMQKGGQATLLIPSALGYGNQAVGNIPANSVLIFDIGLVGFQ